MKVQIFWEYLIICAAALIASGLTLFSGFGLGTLLLPVFAIFFPVDAAVAMTAVVHLFNNIFKLTVYGKHSERVVLLRFALPAIAAAFGGAYLLTWISDFEPIAVYEMGSRVFEILPVKVLIAALMMTFATLEIHPQFQHLEFDRKYLTIGGLLSGFFGGISGHQGALRSAFLARAGLSKEAFVGTGVVIACLVDVSRLSVYSRHLAASGALANWPLLTAATLSAFLGVFFGGRLLKKITMKTIQTVVSVMLFLLALGLGTGLV